MSKNGGVEYLIMNIVNIFETKFLTVYNCKFLSLSVYRMRIELNPLPS